MSTALVQRVNNTNNLRVLLKGKKLPIGSKRKRGNQWWMKTATGWKYSGMVASPTAAAPPTTTSTSAAVPTRNEQILVEFQTGGSTAGIAAKHGLSVVRVRQIIAQQKKKPTTVTAAGDVVTVKSKKTELFDKLTDKQKETSRTTGVIPADKGAADYVQKNMDDIFGTQSEASLPKYIKKITTDPDKAYGKKAGWMSYPQIWKQLEDDAFSWDGNAEQGKAFLDYKDKVISADKLLRNSKDIMYWLADALSVAVDVPISGMAVREEVMERIGLEEYKDIRLGEPFYDKYVAPHRDKIHDRQAALREELKKKAKNVYQFDATKTMAENLAVRDDAIKGIEDEVKGASFSSTLSVERFVDRMRSRKNEWESFSSADDPLSRDSMVDLFKNKSVTDALNEIRIRLNERIKTEPGVSELLDKSDYDVLEYKEYGFGRGTVERLVAVVQGGYTRGRNLADYLTNLMLPTFAKFGYRGRRPASSAYTTVVGSGKLRPSLDYMTVATPDIADYILSQSANVHLQNHMVKTLKKDPKNIKLDPMNKETWKSLQDKAGISSRYELEDPKFTKVVRDYAIEQRKKTFASEASVKRFERLVSGGGKAGNFILRTVKGDHLKKVKSLIEKKWDKVAHGGFGYNIKGVYAIEEPPNQNKFNKIKKEKGDARFLYHGTHFTAAVAISRDKFRVTQQAKTGRMLGSGVYLAENSSKSCQYLASSFSRQKGSRGILFVCEAAMGDVQDSSLAVRADTVRMQRGAGVVNTEYCVRDPNAVLPRMWVDIELT